MRAGLSEAEIEALAAGRHGDPFSLLGPHSCADGIWVRALVPGAIAISVIGAGIDPGIEAGQTTRLAQIHEVGLFAARVGDSIDRYQLKITDAEGRVEVRDDPYRFSSELGDLDRYLLAEGTHLRPWRVLGAHLIERDGVAGVRFAVWAPNASRVAVIGDFNEWSPLAHPMRFHPGPGVFELFVPGVRVGAIYKYALCDREGQALPNKADPYAFASQLRPATASVVASLPDSAGSRPAPSTGDPRASAISIYEVHLGSWRRRSPAPGSSATSDQFLDWDALAEQLPSYVAELGFTHVELLPIAEHPFDGSWGYQVTAMYAPTRRFGDPAGFAKLIAACHAHGLGVLLDWVPAHFPDDPHALARFDGTALYEYADPREGLHKDWNTLIFNFARTEVRNFLVGNALYWLEVWGIDGLRVDAVASMLYRDYSRAPGEWVANVDGGRENLEATALIRRLNEVLAAEAPGALMIAEESTSWDGVTKPLDSAGLGFGFKWNLGWMHDTLGYMAHDPVYRKHHHEALTFGIVYGFDEQFVLPLSHDEVVHGKRSLIGRMPGDRWQRFANLRSYFGFMWAHPGKKLLFMGGEFAQEREWDHDRELDWDLLDGPEHRGVQALIRDLNRLVRASPALYELDGERAGFEWVVAEDRDHSVLAFIRHGKDGQRMLAVSNFTPMPRIGYRVGVDAIERWVERLSTNARVYGGVDPDDRAVEITSEAIESDGRQFSLALDLPPLATILLERLEP